MDKIQLLQRLKEKLAELKKRVLDYRLRASENDDSRSSWSGGGFRLYLEEERQRVERELDQTQEQIQELESLNLEKTETVCEGCLVSLDFGGGEVSAYRILKSAGDPALQILSTSSPIGQAVLGKKIGDEAEVQTPEGSYKVKIVGLAC